MPLPEFTAGPVYMEKEGKGGHEWIIEFQRMPDDMQTFSDLLDEGLRAANSDYDAKRKGDMVLARPIVHDVPKGTFHAWMRSRGKLGGQNKVPRLANDRSYLDAILGAATV